MLPRTSTKCGKHSRGAGNGSATCRAKGDRSTNGGGRGWEKGISAVESPLPSASSVCHGLHALPTTHTLTSSGLIQMHIYGVPIGVLVCEGKKGGSAPVWYGRIEGSWCLANYSRRCAHLVLGPDGGGGRRSVGRSAPTASGAERPPRPQPRRRRRQTRRGKVSPGPGGGEHRLQVSFLCCVSILQNHAYM
jgi:hypothetical protein